MATDEGGNERELGVGGGGRGGRPAKCGGGGKKCALCNADMK